MTDQRTERERLEGLYREGETMARTERSGLPRVCLLLGPSEHDWVYMSPSDVSDAAALLSERTGEREPVATHLSAIPPERLICGWCDGPFPCAEHGEAYPDAAPEPEPSMPLRDALHRNQAKAWEAVYDECRRLGMGPRYQGTGLGRVLDFIRSRAAAPEPAEGREPDAWATANWRVLIQHGDDIQVGPERESDSDVAVYFDAPPAARETEPGELHDAAIMEAALAVMRVTRGNVPPVSDTRIAVETYNRFIADRTPPAPAGEPKWPPTVRYVSPHWFALPSGPGSDVGPFSTAVEAWEWIEAVAPQDATGEEVDE